MAKYSISYIATCPACRYMQKERLKNMGKSHADDFQDRKTMIVQCKSCGRILESTLSGVEVNLQ